MNKNASKGDGQLLPGKHFDVFPAQDPSESKGSADPAPGADPSVLERFQKRPAELNVAKKATTPAQGASGSSG